MSSFHLAENIHSAQTRPIMEIICHSKCKINRKIEKKMEGFKYHINLKSRTADLSHNQSNGNKINRGDGTGCQKQCISVIYYFIDIYHVGSEGETVLLKVWVTFLFYFVFHIQYSLLMELQLARKQSDIFPCYYLQDFFSNFFIFHISFSL